MVSWMPALQNNNIAPAQPTSVNRADALSIVNKTLTAAYQVLKNNKACRDALSGYSNALKAFAGTLKSDNITVKENTDGKGVIAQTFPETGLNYGFMTIYNAFFNNMNFSIGKTDADSLGMGIDEKRLLVILHEIGHITKQFSHGGLIRFPAKEILDQAQTNKKVYENCFPKQSHKIDL
ncbi:MAG: hypothetical protein WKF90_04455 [Pyrinomonadaceae bacterium]